MVVIFLCSCLGQRNTIQHSFCTRRSACQLVVDVTWRDAATAKPAPSQRQLVQQHALERRPRATATGAGRHCADSDQRRVDVCASSQTAHTAATALHSGRWSRASATAHAGASATAPTRARTANCRRCRPGASQHDASALPNAARRRLPSVRVAPLPRETPRAAEPTHAGVFERLPRPSRPVLILITCINIARCTVYLDSGIARMQPQQARRRRQLQLKQAVRRRTHRLKRRRHRTSCRASSTASSAPP